MTTLGHVVRKELRELWRQPGVLIIAAGVAALIAAAVFSAVPQHRAAEAWKRDAAREVREQWITQGVRHPHSAAHYGIIAFRPLDGVAVIEPGVSAHVGQMLPLVTHVRAFPVDPPADAATSATRLGALSPALLALTLIPLAIILVGYGAITRERESGSLGLLLASGVPPRTLIAGKAVAVAVVALALLAVKAAIDAAGAFLAGQALPGGRLLGLELVHVAYVLIWVGLAIGVSARVRSSQTALSILLALWVVNSFVLPRVAASAGRLAVPEPSIEEFRAGIQHDITFRPDGTPWVNDWSAQLIADTLERYGVSRIEDLPVGYAGIMLKSSDAHYEEVFDAHFARLHVLHRRQEQWQHALSAAGPMIAARSLGQAFAGTDLTHTQHFSDAAERYRRLFVEATNDVVEKTSTGTGWDLRVDREYWASIPEFRYEPPAPLSAARQHWLSALVLLLWMGAAGAWCAGGAAALRRT